MGLKEYLRAYFAHKEGDVRYGVKLGAMVALIIGFFLMAEHAWMWDGFDPIWLDPLGHEWIGFYLVLAAAGVFIKLRWDKSTYVKMWREAHAEAEHAEKDR